MPIILKKGNLCVYVYPHDHGQPHVHVYQGSAKRWEKEAKILLDNFVIISNSGFSKRDAHKIINWISEYKEELLNAWEEYSEK